MDLSAGVLLPEVAIGLSFKDFLALLPTSKLASP